jgi:hypothetical protein
MVAKIVKDFRERKERPIFAKPTNFNKFAFKVAVQRIQKESNTTSSSTNSSSTTTTASSYSKQYVLGENSNTVSASSFAATVRKMCVQVVSLQESIIVSENNTPSYNNNIKRTNGQQLIFLKIAVNDDKGTLHNSKSSNINSSSISTANNSSSSSSSSDGQEEEVRNLAARILESFFQVSKAQHSAIARSRSLFDKLFDIDSGYYYFYNRHTLESTQVRPWVLGSSSCTDE